MKKTVFATLAVLALAFPHMLPAHTGNPCPHKDPNHPHCAGGSPGIVERLAVFDAQNQKVGDVIAFERLGGLAQVSFSSGTYSFFLYVFPTRFAGTSPRIHFTGVNCQGTPILEVSGTSGEQRNTLLPLVAVANPGSTIYLAENQGPAETFFFNSILTASFDNDLGGVCDSPGGNNPVNGREATLLLDLNALLSGC